MNPLALGLLADVHLAERHRAAGCDRPGPEGHDQVRILRHGSGRARWHGVRRRVGWALMSAGLHLAVSAGDAGAP